MPLPVAYTTGRPPRRLTGRRVRASVRPFRSAKMNPPSAVVSSKYRILGRQPRSDGGEGDASAKSEPESKKRPAAPLGKRKRNDSTDID